MTQPTDTAALLALAAAAREHVARRINSAWAITNMDELQMIENLAAAVERLVQERSAKQEALGAALELYRSALDKLNVCRKERDAARAALEAVEFVDIFNPDDGYGSPACPWCGWYSGHREGCQRQAALGLGGKDGDDEP